MSEYDSATLLTLGERALQTAKQFGATSSEVAITIDSGFDLNVRMGQVESLTHQVQQSLDINVFIQQKSGSASTTDLSESAVLQTIEKACAIAQFTQDDPCTGLADKEQLAVDWPDCDLDHPWSITPDQAIDLAVSCESAGMAVDSRIDNSDGTNLSTNRAQKCYLNSLGFSGVYQSTSHSMYCGLIAKQQGAMQRDYEYAYARDYRDLLDATTVGQRAGQRAVDRLGPRSIKTQQAPVVFRYDLAASLLSNFIRGISGSNIYRHASFLVGALDQQIFPKWLSLRQAPHIKKGIASRPYDSEGVATVDRDLVTDGVLQSYIMSSYSARKLGMHSTGNAGGVQNVLVSHNEDLELSDLLAQMGTGLLVTELIGQGVNMVTGDYSRGAFGYWVENGEIQHPVDGITIAGNLKDMFANIQAIANDVEQRRSIRTGSILIDGMMIAGA